MGQDESLLNRLRGFYDYGAVALDEMELESWAGLFVEDALYMVVSRENFDRALPHATIYCDSLGMINDRVTAIRQAMVFEERHLRHLVSGVRVNRSQDGIVEAQANFLIVESMSDSRPEIAMVGRYLDVLEDRGDAFAIRERRCVFDNYWTARSVIIPA